MTDKKLNLRFTKRHNGYFCELVGGELGVDGVCGFGMTPEEAESVLHKLVQEIRKEQLSTKPHLLIKTGISSS